MATRKAAWCVRAALDGLNQQQSPHPYKNWFVAFIMLFLDFTQKFGRRFFFFTAGHGVHLSYEGEVYRGTWKDGKQHGRGVFVWEDGRIYTGDFKDGRRDGNGCVR